MEYKLTKNLRIVILFFVIALFGYFIGIGVKNDSNPMIIDNLLHINGVIGIFLGPNEAEAIKIKKEGGEGLDEYVSDSQYYQKLAWYFLEGQNILNSPLN